MQASVKWYKNQCQYVVVDKYGTRHTSGTFKNKENARRNMELYFRRHELELIHEGIF